MKYLIILLILFSGTAFSQGLNERPKRTASQEALIDSAVRLEVIKIAFAHLTTAYELKSKEAIERDNAQRMCEMQNVLQGKGFEKQVADIKSKYKGRWWKGFGAGGLATMALMTAMIIF